MEKPPNILFAFADDWGRYASAYGAIEGPNSINHCLSTPAFDRIAREGVLFTNAMVPAPSCTPCRSSILSGQYFWQTGLGAILHGAVWDESIPTYPLELEKAGYHIGFTYKVWSPGRGKDAPYGGERTKYEPAGNRFRRFSHQATERAREIGVAAAKEELFQETRANFSAFLADREPDQPFCYWWGPTNTHRTWEPGSGKALWGLDPDKLEGRLPGFLPDVPEIREDVADYLGEAMAFDQGVSVLLEQLEEAGELDNTLVVVSGDHGIPGIPRGKCNLYDLGSEVALAIRLPRVIPSGRAVHDLVNLMDLAPTFLDAAAVPPPETMSARSLWPLLTSQGAGQVEPDRTFVVTGRERHVADARAGNLPYPQRAIRTNDYLYVKNYAPDRWPMGDPHGLDDPAAPAPAFDSLAWNTMTAYGDLDASPTKAWFIHHRTETEVWPRFELGFGKRPAEELFAIRDDPDQMQNLAESPDHQSAKLALARQLASVQEAFSDPRHTEHPCRYENPPYTAPREAGQR